MKKLKIIIKFILFLIDNKALIKFIKSYHSEYRFENNSKSIIKFLIFNYRYYIGYINFAFIWGNETNYWYKLDVKWRKVNNYRL